MAALYPTFSVDFDAALGYNTIENRSLLVIEVTVAASSVTSVVMTHVAQVQDWSLRCWVSTRALGASVEGDGPLATWELQRMTPQPLCLHTPDMPPLAGSHAISLLPGQYCINVLNLINQTNVFQFAKL